MNEISDTPRTDAAIIKVLASSISSGETDFVWPNFARTLEREKTGLEQTVRELRDKLDMEDDRFLIVEMERDSLEQTVAQLRETVKLEQGGARFALNATEKMQAERNQAWTERGSLRAQLEEANKRILELEHRQPHNVTLQIKVTDLEEKLASAQQENEKLRAEVARLRDWKVSALAVEARWDIQNVGKLLGLTPGQDIRSQIEPAIARLKEDKERLIFVAKYVARIVHYARDDRKSDLILFPEAEGTAWHGIGPDLMTAFRAACDEIIAFERATIDTAKGGKA